VAPPLQHLGGKVGGKSMAFPHEKKGMHAFFSGTNPMNREHQSLA